MATASIQSSSTDPSTNVFRFFTGTLPQWMTVNGSVRSYGTGSWYRDCWLFQIQLLFFCRFNWIPPSFQLRWNRQYYSPTRDVPNNHFMPGLVDQECGTRKIGYLIPVRGVTPALEEVVGFFVWCGPHLRRPLDWDCGTIQTRLSWHSSVWSLARISFRRLLRSQAEEQQKRKSCLKAIQAFYGNSSSTIRAIQFTTHGTSVFVHTTIHSFINYHTIQSFTDCYDRWRRWISIHPTKDESYVCQILTVCSLPPLSRHLFSTFHFDIIVSVSLNNIKFEPNLSQLVVNVTRPNNMNTVISAQCGGDTLSTSDGSAFISVQ